MNLIICYTPLQVVIAEKIMDLYPNESFFGVMIHSVNNAKFEHYKQRLKNRSVDFFSHHQKTDRWGLLAQTLSLKHHFSGKRFDKVFLASINDLQIQTLLSHIQFNHLFTFDDGTANIEKSSCFYIDEPNTLIRRCANYLLGNRLNLRKIKALSQGHYTIYPTFPNIIEHTIELKLIDPSPYEMVENSEITHILLGQPIYLSAEKNIALAQNVIARFGIDQYLPHPREQYRLENIEYLDTPLIFEDYICQQAQHKKYRVYTYFSSAVLNVLNLSNIEVVILRVNTENPAFEACYDLFVPFGLPIVDIRE